MAVDPIKHSRVAARCMVAGFIVAAVGAGLAAEPFAAVTTFGAGLFLLGLRLASAGRRTLVRTLVHSHVPLPRRPLGSVGIQIELPDLMTAPQLSKCLTKGAARVPGPRAIRTAPMRCRLSRR